MEGFAPTTTWLQSQSALLLSYIPYGWNTGIPAKGRTTPSRARLTWNTEEFQNLGATLLSRIALRLWNERDLNPPKPEGT